MHNMYSCLSVMPRGPLNGECVLPCHEVITFCNCGAGGSVCAMIWSRDASVTVPQSSTSPAAPPHHRGNRNSRRRRRKKSDRRFLDGFQLYVVSTCSTRHHLRSALIVSSTCRSSLEDRHQEPGTAYHLQSGVLLH